MILPQKHISDNKQKLFFIFRGDKQILPHINLRLQMTIIVQKPFVTCITIAPIFPQTQLKHDQDIIEPLIGIQVLGEPQREYLMRNKHLIKDNFLYVYFPSNITVNEKVNKIYLNSYEMFMKQMPKNMKNNFCKLILYQAGSGENSIDQQKNRCSDAIGNLFKNSMQRRVQQYLSQMNNISYSQLNIKVISSIFRNKCKLAYIYRKIGLQEKAEEVLSLLWQDMLYNQRYFHVEKDINYSRDILYLPPFVERSYHKILKQFYAPNHFLKICSHAFFKIFELQVQLMNYCESMKKLKHFIQFSISNVFNLVKTKTEIIKHVWIVSIIDQASDIVHKLGRSFPTFLNPQKEQEYQAYAVVIARAYRNSLQLLGAHLYNFNPLTLYPRSFETQIDYSLFQLNSSQNTTINIQSEEIKLLMDRVQQNLLLLFGGFQGYKVLYLKSLINQYEVLSRSSLYKRLARSVKLSLLKTFLAVMQPHNIQFSQTLLKQYAREQSQLPTYIEKILKKAQKIAIHDEDDIYINDALFKRSYKYQVEKDNFINRNRQDECLWPTLKFIEDYYKFILLLILLRNQVMHEKRKDDSLSLQFSRIHSKFQVKTDNIIHLLLNRDLMTLKHQWNITVNLVRQIFLLQKGQQSKLPQTTPVNIRLGILLDAHLTPDPKQTLSIKVNNQQLANLIFLFQSQLIQLQLSIIDANKRSKHIKLQLVAVRPSAQQFLELELVLMSQEPLIFIIKQIQIKIGMLMCYYVNKNLELQELREMEEEGRGKQKKNRKYSSFQQKLKEEEFIHMINKSDNLTLNHIHYHTITFNQPTTPNIDPIIDTYRNTQQLRDSSSQSSLYGLLKQKINTVPLYIELWTPVVFKLKPAFRDRKYSVGIVLNKILPISCEVQEISQWVKIQQVWVNRNQSGVYEVQVGGEEIEIVIMVRSKAGREVKNAKKVRKGSAASRSIFSSNASWDRSESLRLQLQLKQGQYTYLLQSVLHYNRNKPFSIKYLYCEQLQQYTIQNQSTHTLLIHPKPPTSPITLKPNEQLKLQSEQAQIQILMEELPSIFNRVECENGRPTFISHVNLQHYVRKELLKPYKLETINLSVIQQQRGFRRMDLIRIGCEFGGLLSILDGGCGFELVGRVEGELTCQHGILDLFLIPVKTGKLILPSLLIGGKKGVWMGSIFVIVKD